MLIVSLEIHNPKSPPLQQSRTRYRAIVQLVLVLVYMRLYFSVVRLLLGLTSICRVRKGRRDVGGIEASDERRCGWRFVKYVAQSGDGLGMKMAAFSSGAKICTHRRVSYRLVYLRHQGCSRCEGVLRFVEQIGVCFQVSWMAFVLLQ